MYIPFGVEIAKENFAQEKSRDYARFELMAGRYYCSFAEVEITAETIYKNFGLNGKKLCLRACQFVIPAN